MLTLVTQFGGGKTHTLTALYHLAKAGKAASDHPGIPKLLSKAGLREVPRAAVGVFVGSAWDPQEGPEAPWIDVARQVAGDRGVAALGSSATDVPPGTEALARVFAEADAPVLFLFRRGPELRQPSPGLRRAVLCVHPEPDRSGHGNHARGRGYQPASQPD